MRALKGKAPRTVLWVVVGIVVVLALAQVLLPGIAASRISSRVGRYGTVRSVSVTAWPAIELLWGSADSVRVTAGSLTVSPEQTAKLLWEGRRLASVDVTAATVKEGPLRLTDVSFHKRGGTLAGQGLATAQDVRRALPPGLSVRLLSSEHGAVRVRASGGLFGAGASVDAVGEASAGRLIARPEVLSLAGLRLTLFSDPHVYVREVGASVEHRVPLTYRLTMGASLR